MNVKKIKKIYKKVYKIIGKSTPLYGDCGLLCNNECCKGDLNTGMILFPGEEKFFEDKKDKDFTLSTFNLNHNTKAVLFVCNGTCNRKHRPLSCRIFPYLPVVDDTGVIKIIKDPRAYSVCPLVQLEESDFHGTKDETFEDRLAAAFSFLLELEPIPEFLKALEHNANEYKLLRESFLKKSE